MAKDRNCGNCILCAREDYGYSNWTVEGTTVRCMLGLNVGFPLEDAYGDPTPAEVAILDFAEQCPRFIAGPPASMDVERESIPYDREPTDTELLNYCAPEALGVFRAYLKGTP